jgi:hypothetical protein
MYPGAKFYKRLSIKGNVIQRMSPIIVRQYFAFTEDAMRTVLHERLKMVWISLRKHLNKREKWIKEHPGQLCITASQVNHFTPLTHY